VECKRTYKVKIADGDICFDESYETAPCGEIIVYVITYTPGNIYNEFGGADNVLLIEDVGIGCVLSQD